MLGLSPRGEIAPPWRDINEKTPSPVKDTSRPDSGRRRDDARGDPCGRPVCPPTQWTVGDGLIRRLVRDVQSGQSQGRLQGRPTAAMLEDAAPRAQRPSVLQLVFQTRAFAHLGARLILLKIGL